ncbi:hypothetical protein ACFJIY_23945 [Pimelobacter simplex]|uniref:hypothetical protein n=1 Tax=Nocardioides simplex TaxID=2045 RepID=UPI003672F191
MSDLADRLRADLTTALRARDRTRASVLRTVLGAIANAEAVPVPQAAPPLAEGVIAGAVVGLGAAEAPRRELREDDVRAIVVAERDDLLAHGMTAEAALLAEYLSVAE